MSSVAAYLSPALVVSIVLQLALFFGQDKLPLAHPKKISSTLTKVVGGTVIVLTGANISVMNLLLARGPWPIVVTLLALAILAPVVGKLEARYGNRGDAVFQQSRFAGHLTTNVLGALAVAGFVWAATSTPRFDAFAASFGDAAVFNIALPMAVAVAVAFARSEQGRHSGGVDLETASGHVAETAITGYSLRHAHQFINTIFLTAVIFVAGAMLLYLFAHTTQSAKAGAPLRLSWIVVVAIAFTLAFFLACGFRGSRGSRTVWMTFVTGTPAAMGFSLVWLALFENSMTRNIAILLLISVAYIAYCVEFILAEKENGGRVEAHYFSSVAVAFTLAMLMLAVYVS